MTSFVVISAPEGEIIGLSRFVSGLEADSAVWSPQAGGGGHPRVGPGRGGTWGGSRGCDLCSQEKVLLSLFISQFPVL